MTTRYTHEEWMNIFSHAQSQAPDRTVIHRTPLIGSPEFAKFIDHTLLKVEATKDQIDQLCMEARNLGFGAVCVRPRWVSRAVDDLRGTAIAVACVVGFPEGTQSIAQKVTEAQQAVRAGAQELDMVLNYPLLQKKEYEQVFTDIAAVRAAAPQPIILKVILETSQLSSKDIIAGCKIAVAAHADFVKTSTGFNGGGASEENVRLMKWAVGEGSGVKVKASGGIKTLTDCVRMIEAGADRIGTSSGIWIMREARQRLDDVSYGGVMADGEKTRSQTLLTRLYSD